MILSATWNSHKFTKSSFLEACTVAMVPPSKRQKKEKAGKAKKNLFNPTCDRILAFNNPKQLDANFWHVLEVKNCQILDKYVDMNKKMTVLTRQKPARILYNKKSWITVKIHSRIEAGFDPTDNVCRIKTKFAKYNMEAGDKDFNKAYSKMVLDFGELQTKDKPYNDMDDQQPEGEVEVAVGADHIMESMSVPILPNASLEEIPPVGSQPPLKLLSSQPNLTAEPRTVMVVDPNDLNSYIQLQQQLNSTNQSLPDLTDFVNGTQGEVQLQVQVQQNSQTSTQALVGSPLLRPVDTPKLLSTPVAPAGTVSGWTPDAGPTASNNEQTDKDYNNNGHEESNRIEDTIYDDDLGDPAAAADGDQAQGGGPSQLQGGPQAEEHEVQQQQQQQQEQEQLGEEEDEDSSSASDEEEVDNAGGYKPEMVRKLLDDDLGRYLKKYIDKKFLSLARKQNKHHKKIQQDLQAITNLIVARTDKNEEIHRMTVQMLTKKQDDLSILRLKERLCLPFNSVTDLHRVLTDEDLRLLLIEYIRKNVDNTGNRYGPNFVAKIFDQEATRTMIIDRDEDDKNWSDRAFFIGGLPVYELPPQLLPFFRDMATEMKAKLEMSSDFTMHPIPEVIKRFKKAFDNRKTAWKQTLVHELYTRSIQNDNVACIAHMLYLDARFNMKILYKTAPPDVNDDEKFNEYINNYYNDVVQDERQAKLNPNNLPPCDPTTTRMSELRASEDDKVRRQIKELFEM